MDVVSLGYRTDLALLQIGGTQIEDRGDHIVVRSSHNPTHWWGNFLLLDQAPTPEGSGSWLERFAETVPAAAHVALGFDGTQGTTSDLDWFTAHGFTAEAQTVMTATEVREPPRLNRDAVYRRLRSDEDWADSVELRIRCSDQGREPAADYRGHATAKARTNRALVNAGHGGWFGAFLDGRLVSQMGLLSVSPGLARFQFVETDPQCRPPSPKVTT